MNAKDVTITVPEPFMPGADDLQDIPARFQGASASEITKVRFRCPHCGIPHQAAILPQSPRIAKFYCRRCENTIDIETRPSVMDHIEQECDLRKDIGHVTDHPKAFSKDLGLARRETALYQASPAFRREADAKTRELFQRAQADLMASKLR